MAKERWARRMGETGRGTLAWEALAALAALALYARTVGFGWVYDDQMEIVLNNLLSGLQPWSYHLVNVLLMGALAAMVVRLGKRWGLSALAAGLGGLIFAFHPVHVEVVAPVYGRKDLLAAFFLLAALLTQDGARKQGGWRRGIPPLALGAALLLLPLTLSPDYSFDAIPLATSLLDPRLLATLVALAAGGGLLVWKGRRHGILVLGAGWYLVTFLPTANLLVVVGTIFGERLLFLPSLAFRLLAGWRGFSTPGRPCVPSSRRPAAGFRLRWSGPDGPWRLFGPPDTPGGGDPSTGPGPVAPPVSTALWRPGLPPRSRPFYFCPFPGPLEGSHRSLSP